MPCHSSIKNGVQSSLQLHKMTSNNGVQKGSENKTKDYEV